MPLLKLFNKPIPGGCRYENTLHDWYDSPSSIDEKVMSHNLAHEHRVSGARRSAFEAGIPASCSGGDLKAALESYHQTYVASVSPPHFLDAAMNEQNFAHPVWRGRPFGSAPPVISPDLELAHVLNLSGLLYVLGTKRGWIPDGPIKSWLGNDARRRPRHSHSCADDLTLWRPTCLLDRYLLRTTRREQRAFVSTIFFEAEEQRLHHGGRYNISWVTSWDRFNEEDRVVRGSPGRGQRWTEVVGLRAPNIDTWFLVLRYPVSTAHRLARPTQLDAGYFANHMPSPPGVEATEGGYTVDQCLSPLADKLTPEWIHAQIPFDTRHWRAARFRLERVAASSVTAPATAPEARRQHHWRLMQDEHPSVDVAGWMPSGI